MVFDVSALRSVRKTSDPASPPSGYDAIYTKSDGLYVKSPDGAVTKVGPFPDVLTTDAVKARTSSGLSIQDNSGNYGVFISSGGNVGVKTNSPTAVLDVNGQIRIRGGTPGTGKLLSSDSTGVATWGYTVTSSVGSPGSSTNIPTEAAVRSALVHSGLSGLSNDDHTQYLTTGRHDTTSRHTPGSVVPVVTSIGDPGSDSNIPTEKAVRTLVNTKMTGTLVTSVGTPGADTNVPSEKAVRNAVNDMTNLASVVHVLSSKTTPVDADETFLIDSAASYGPKRLTWANLKATLKTYNDTLYAPIYKGVTNGDSHDHSGGDGAQISHSNLSNLTADDHTQYLNTTRHDNTARHGSSVVDHGSIGGLRDDDHTQYLNTSRHDTTSRHTPGTVIPLDTTLNFPGSSTAIPSESAVAAAIKTNYINFLISGGGAVIQTGMQGAVQVPWACTLTSVRLISVDGTSGDIRVAVKKSTYADHPTLTDIASLWSSTKASSGINVSLSAGDYLYFDVTSVSGIKLLLITFTAQRS